MAPTETPSSSEAPGRLAHGVGALQRFGKWIWKPVVLAVIGIVLGCVALVLCTLALNTGSEDKTSDWISAFGTLFGAALTGGALLIAAFTYKHQVDERNRAAEEGRRLALRKRSEQARAIKLIAESRAGWTDQWDCTVRNDSPVAIDAAGLLITESAGGEPTWHRMGAIKASGGQKHQTIELQDFSESYLTFLDADGILWRRYFDGRLEEQEPVMVGTGGTGSG